MRASVCGAEVQIFLNVKSHYSFRLMVRTIPFHGIDMGSNLIKSTRLKFTFFQRDCNHYQGNYIQYVLVI